MSKSKLALLVFALAFGVNIVAFVFSKKAYVIEELKNVWLYELPLTASPLDAYVGVDFTPQHGVIGTLAHVSDQYEFKAGKGKEPSVLRINLKEGLSFSNGDPITTKDWMDTRAWALTYVRHWSADPMWDAYAKADMSFPSVNQAQFTWAQLPKDFNACFHEDYALPSNDGSDSPCEFGGDGFTQSTTGKENHQALDFFWPL